MNAAGFVIGKDLIPSTAPHVVEESTGCVQRGQNAGMMPQKLRAKGFIDDLPEFAARAWKHGETQKTVFKMDGVQAMQSRVPGSDQSIHDTTANSAQTKETGTAAPQRNGWINKN